SKLKDEILKIKEKRKEYNKENNKYLKAIDLINKIDLKPENELYKAAFNRLMWFKSIVPEFYIELQNHGLKEEAYVMPILLKLARETNTPIIAANDAHITSKTQNCVEGRRIVRFNYFDKAVTLNSTDRELYIKTDNELYNYLVKILPEEAVNEAINATNILDTFKVVFPQEEHYPSIKLIDKTPEMYFDELLNKAKEDKINKNEWSEKYENRLQHEIQVIKNMGFVDYHLVVRDICYAARLMGKIPKQELNSINFETVEDYIKEKGYKYGIGVGSGRGSAVGSLVCYLLGITNVDPLKYNLLFERFLNPERVTMPDIDVDISTSLRPTIIKYLKWRHGENAVCSIATELTYGAKNAIKMVGRDRASQLYEGDSEKKRAYMHKYAYPLSDIVPEEPGITLEKCEDLSKLLTKEDKEYELLWNEAKLIEGKVNSSSIHAGGVIISDNDNVNDYVPLAWSDKGVWAAQCTMTKVEEKGLLKMDVLGLNTLDCISDCIEAVNKYKGIDIDIEHVPFEKEVFTNIFAKGNTNSIFQFESSGMKAMLTEFKPNCFEDLILLIAAYRPGAMQYLDDIIDIKNGRKTITYKTPELEDILKNTYGAIIYQEQVMQLFQKLAGYSLGGADLVRRAMSKKKSEKLAKERKAFIYGDTSRNIKGCIANGIKEDVANELFNEMMEFAKYAFNKSHAAAYAYLSYQTAYLKYHYPTEYLCAMFNNKEQKDFAPLLQDCEEYDIKLLPIDINKSYYKFVCEDKNIRYGFSGIKGLGETSLKICDFITQKRKEILVFTTFQEFLTQTLINKGDDKYSLIPSKTLMCLTEVGAFDSLGYNRKDLKNLPKINDNTKEVLEEKIKSLQISKRSNDDERYNIDREMEYLGHIISIDPLKSYGSDDEYGCLPLSELKNDSIVNVFGYISQVDDRISKKGNKVRIITLHLKAGGNISALLMGNNYSRFEEKDLICNVFKITGKYNGSSIFVENNGIKKLYSSKEKYQLIVDTEELYKTLLGIFNKQNKTGKKIYVLSYYTKNGECIKRNLIPFYQEIWINDKDFVDLQKRGIIFEKSKF
nr:DNA polymerase III subunit alpha [Lachnospiraceae bacterium]